VTRSQLRNSVNSQPASPPASQPSTSAHLPVVLRATTLSQQRLTPSSNSSNALFAVGSIPVFFLGCLPRPLSSERRRCQNHAQRAPKPYRLWDFTCSVELPCLASQSMLWPSLAPNPLNSPPMSSRSTLLLMAGRPSRRQLLARARCCVARRSLHRPTCLPLMRLAAILMVHHDLPMAATLASNAFSLPLSTSSRALSAAAVAAPATSRSPVSTGPTWMIATKTAAMTLPL